MLSLVGGAITCLSSLTKLLSQIPFAKSITPKINLIASTIFMHAKISGALKFVNVARRNAVGNDMKVANPLSKIKVSVVFPPERKVK